MDWDNKEYVQATIRQLGRLRAWFEGFEAAGGKGLPNCTDALRKAQLLMEKKL